MMPPGAARSATAGDYRGAEGAYSSGKHFTGIKGIAGAAGADPATIAATLRADPHGYTTDMIPDAAMNDLALFVSKGQIDPAPYMSDGKSSGDVVAGKGYYEGICAGCHGLDGRKIKDADSLGAVSGNTVEMMHKVLNWPTRRIDAGPALPGRASGGRYRRLRTNLARVGRLLTIDAMSTFPEIGEGGRAFPPLVSNRRHRRSTR